MCDWTADAVWDSRGRCCSADELPVSDALRDELRRWQQAYDDSGLDGSEHTRNSRSPPFDQQAHSRWGLVLARRVKAELPDWTVVYFDEWAAKSIAGVVKGKQREKFEYPV